MKAQDGFRLSLRGGRFRIWLVSITVWLVLLQPSNPVKAASGIETAGDVLLYALPTAGAGLTLAYRDGQGALEFGESLALTAGVTYGLKYAVDERRPNGGRYSFPSGHASFSFSSAEFMRKRYGWEYGIPAYALASFVAYSRVESGQHYAHDVIAGASIGIVSSYIFTRPYKGWNANVEADTRSFAFKISRAF
jgi:membrane-associated phospholipid phosphatase